MATNVGKMIITKNYALWLQPIIRFVTLLPCKYTLLGRSPGCLKKLAYAVN